MSRSMYYQLPPDRESKPVVFSDAFDTATLKDQNVLITGGATGIGAGCVAGFAKAGAYVTVADVNESDAAQAVQELTSAGHKVQFVKTDVTSWASQVGAFKAALAFGPHQTLDIVVPNAGVGGPLLKDWVGDEGGARLDEAGDPLPVARPAMNVNIDGVYSTAHLALHYFKQFPGRKEVDKQIVFVASMAGFSSMTGAPDYCTSKWAVRGLFRSFRGAQRILGEDLPVLRCNMICPGYVKTPLTKELWEVAEKGQMRMADVSDVVDVVLRIAAVPGIIGKFLLLLLIHFGFFD